MDLTIVGHEFNDSVADLKKKIFSLSSARSLKKRLRFYHR